MVGECESFYWWFSSVSRPVFGERPMLYLEGDDNIGRAVLDLAHDLWHVELVRQLVHDVVQDLLHLSYTSGEGHQSLAPLQSTTQQLRRREEN